MVGKGLEQNSGSGFDKCRDITRAIIPATLYLQFPCSFTTPRDNLASPPPFYQRPSNQTFSFPMATRLLITVHCSQGILTNKLPIQTRVRHLEVVNGSLMKSVESCEGRIVFRASRESRVNSREEKQKRKKERNELVGKSLRVWRKHVHTITS